MTLPRANKLYSVQFLSYGLKDGELGFDSSQVQKFTSGVTVTALGNKEMS